MIRRVRNYDRNVAIFFSFLPGILAFARRSYRRTLYKYDNSSTDDHVSSSVIDAMRCFYNIFSTNKKKSALNFILLFCYT